MASPDNQTAGHGGALRAQVDSWNFSQLDWRMAVSLTPAGGTATVGGCGGVIHP
jgi:hypothetical protein